MKTLQKTIENRRNDLGMTKKDLARRAGLSRATLNRLYHDDFTTQLNEIAEALGLEIVLRSKESPQRFRLQAAEKKASRLASMVQATSGLEAQAVAPSVVEETRNAMCSRLMGSSRLLWG
ncbi:MAG TPA: XRE family transcriptional regulator [Planctomycetes bacterium]|nr:XRE family transcriptional regulator [Planctomycetota bacterium]